MLSVRGLEHYHNTGSLRSPKNWFLGAKLTSKYNIVDVVLHQLKKTDKQNFSYFDPCKLINNKINRRHK